MSDSYVAMQPILNAKSSTLGYELLFRDGENNAFPTNMSADRATYRLIVENFLSTGQGPTHAYSRCFINFPYKSLIRQLPLTLPKEQIVVEVLESCTPTDELFDAIRYLYRQGYMIALDDFVYSPPWERFLRYTHIVKLDIMALGVQEACDFVKERRVLGTKIRFLAERVETHDEFVLTRDAGFDLFQGYFFKKPQIVKQPYIGPDRLTAMNLFIEVSKSSVDFVQVEKIVTKDVTLSYKLLRFVNLMSNRTSVKITSFRQALVYLGEENLRTFVSLAVASYLAESKPIELYRLALQRGHFCHLMSAYPLFAKEQERAFIIGLFSVLDALFDTPMNELIVQLPLSLAIKEALLSQQGPYGYLLALCDDFDMGDWQGITAHCGKLGMSVDEVHHNLLQAQRWSQDSKRVL
jgi:c-di-GMP phosphodiesterase